MQLDWIKEGKSKCKLCVFTPESLRHHENKVFVLKIKYTKVTTISNEKNQIFSTHQINWFWVKQFELLPTQKGNKNCLSTV